MSEHLQPACFVGAQDCLFARDRYGTANMTAFVQQYTGIASVFTGAINMNNELSYVIMSGRVNGAREPGCYLGQSMLSLGLSMREGSENMILFNDTEVFTDLSHLQPMPIAHKAVHAQCAWHTGRCRSDLCWRVQISFWHNKGAVIGLLISIDLCVLIAEIQAPISVVGHRFHPIGCAHAKSAAKGIGCADQSVDQRNGQTGRQISWTLVHDCGDKRKQRKAHQCGHFSLICGVILGSASCRDRVHQTEIWSLRFG